MGKKGYNWLKMEFFEIPQNSIILFLLEVA